MPGAHLIWQMGRVQTKDLTNITLATVLALHYVQSRGVHLHVANYLIGTVQKGTFALYACNRAVAAALP